MSESSTANSSPPKTRRGVLFPQLSAEAFGDLDEELVTEQVAEAVVEVLEVVEVEPEHRVRVAAALGVGDGPRKAVQEEHPVGQAREAVIEGLVTETLLEARRSVTSVSEPTIRVAGAPPPGTARPRHSTHR